MEKNHFFLEACSACSQLSLHQAKVYYSVLALKTLLVVVMLFWISFVQHFSVFLIGENMYIYSAYCFAENEKDMESWRIFSYLRNYIADLWGLSF